MRKHWIVAAAGGVVLLALLMLAAVGSRQEGWGGGRRGTTRAVPGVIIDSAYTLLALAMLAVAVVLVLRLRGRLPPFKPRERSHWLTALGLFLFSFLAAVVIVNLDVYGRLPELLANAAQNQQQRGPGAVPGTPGAEQPRDPQFQWWLASLAATAALALYLWRKRHRDAHPGKRRQLAEELEAVLADTLEDLRAERDPRRAVIRAYARMERVFAAHGLPRAAHETPLEYLGRLLRDLRVRATAAHALTELFERAKFSRHEIDLAMKEEAIAALETVRADLKVAA
jgi:hypothetical protein